MKVTSFLMAYYYSLVHRVQTSFGMRLTLKRSPLRDLDLIKNSWLKLTQQLACPFLEESNLHPTFKISKLIWFVEPAKDIVDHWNFPIEKRLSSYAELNTIIEKRVLSIECFSFVFQSGWTFFLQTMEFYLRAVPCPFIGRCFWLPRFSFQWVLTELRQVSLIDLETLSFGFAAFFWRGIRLACLTVDICQSNSF